MKTVLTGSCHCGTVTASFETSLGADAIRPRDCGCTFCQKHKPNWFADSAGSLAIEYTLEPIRYRFGTKTADFLICQNCGVVMAAVCEIEGRAYAVFNLNVLDSAHDWTANAQQVDFDGEGTGDRLARRAKNWMPVTIRKAP